MITIVDYGIGNLRSVQKAFEHVGAATTLANTPRQVRGARRLVLPGVGAFGAGMAALRARGLVNPIREVAGQGTPLLGICLGMQLLFSESMEMGRHEGLGLLPGQVLRFPAGGLNVPHVGWNQVEHNGSHPLLQGVAPGAHAYFVHSYYCAPQAAADVIASTRYGQPFAAVVGRGHVAGVQFHPEKSQQVGLQILRNFAQADPR